MGSVFGISIGGNVGFIDGSADRRKAGVGVGAGVGSEVDKSVREGGGDVELTGATVTGDNDAGIDDVVAGEAVDGVKVAGDVTGLSEG